MKIAICFHPINDLGGIINHTEELARGLQELGHTTDLLWFYHQEKFSSAKRSENTIWDSCSGAFEIPYNQKVGWMLHHERNKVSYKGKQNLKDAKERLAKYDLVIWSVPVPTRQKQNKGNNHWHGLYTANKNQIAIIHDANIARSTPWVLAIAKHLKALVCVHEASYHTSAVLGVPRALIFNPHDLSKVEKKSEFDKRRAGFLSVQVFKRIKRVDELLRAIPYMQKVNKANMYVAGGGMEYHYMTSKNKCKKEYEGVWKAALNGGMDYLGFITNDHRDKLLHIVRCMIDASWDKHYSKHGGHFNRTIVEAMKCGCMPIARDLGMSDNKSGKNLLFTPDENYVMIPHNAIPKQFARIVDKAINDRKLFKKITENNFKLLKYFDRKVVAEQILKVAKGKKVGLLCCMEKTSPDPVVKSEAMKACINFFGMKKKRR